MKCICSDGACSATTTTGECFKDFWIFENFSEGQMDELQKIGLKRTIQAGSPVFMQGSPADEMFLIKTGRIKLTKIHHDGNEVTLDFRKAGDVLGEDVFSSESDYPLGAWAIEDTVTCGFGIQDFNALVLGIRTLA
ncbi:cyclic nucleotide-binding domain-containing protein [Pseudodesulfovibrio sp.]|nr:cyclic nucleotide-binding domain-containing protein [Pseudodesulfovibrio sp.]